MWLDNWFLCRQVDDFSIATPDPEIACYIYAQIGQKLQLPGETDPPFVDEGLVDSFNGVDILQTRDYIKFLVRHTIFLGC
jgi:hypothetical protein